jgi:hypothetical protein
MDYHQWRMPFGAYSNTALRMSACAIVKYGPGVKIEEFTNLQTAYEVLDTSIVYHSHTASSKTTE